MAVFELRAHGRTAIATLPYDAMDMKGWHRRNRIVYRAPPSIVATYLPLSSRVFATQYCGETEAVSSPMVAVGDLGLGFALDDDRLPVVSVEAVALMQLVQTEGHGESIPDWLTRLTTTWTSGQCLLLFHPETGWRGAFSEHRLWSCLLLRDRKAIKTPYCKAVVRGWFPDAALEDLTARVGEETVDRVATTVQECGFDGVPDLVLWNQGILWVVEVKSGSDKLSDTQVTMLTRLARIEGVRCQVCCAAGALKRMAATMEACSEETDDEM